MQGVLYPSGIINQFLQLIIILWGVFAAVKVFTCRGFKIPPLAATYILCLMFIIYGTFHLLFGNFHNIHIPDSPSRYIYLQVSLRSLLPVFVFYNYSSEGLVTEKRVQIYTILLIVLGIFRFYETQQQLILEFGTSEITNNMGYVFTCVIPLLLFFYKRPVIQYVLLGVVLLFVFFALKRGAVLVALICCSLIILYRTKIYDSKRQKLIATVSLIILSFIAISFIKDNLQNNDYFTQRIEQTLNGDSSARDVLYSSIIDSILKEQNVLYFLFGRGADSTFAIAGDYAHQDWLETWCNNGLLGVAILLIFFITMYLDVRKAKKRLVFPYYLSYLLLFIVLLSRTMFSMSIQNLEPSQTLLLGYIIYLNRAY